ncbi:MAG TPA: hypothetical protein VIO86_00370 [Candidatus Dormibacteraeota bacterium]|jgi:hypothetical protein
MPLHPEGSESPETADSARAAHWREFYDQVINFEERILRQMIELSSNMAEEQRHLVQETNIQPLGALIDDFKRRRQLWRQRDAKRKEPTA